MQAMRLPSLGRRGKIIPGQTSYPSLIQKTVNYSKPKQVYDWQERPCPKYLQTFRYSILTTGFAASSMWVQVSFLHFFKGQVTHGHGEESA